MARLTTALTTAALALGVLGAGTGTAHAAAAPRPMTVRPAWSGGGCGTAGGGGFNAGSCISGSGTSSISDAYVNSISGCYTLDIIQYDNRSAVMGSIEYANQCGTGHFAGPTYSGLGYWGPFETKVVISVNGVQKLVVWSPDLNS